MTLTEFIDTWIPPWVIGTIIMIVPAVVVLVIYRWFIRRLTRLAGHYSPFLQKKRLSRGQGAASTILVIIALGLALPAANFPAPVTLALGRALLVGFVLALGWRPQSRSISASRFTSDVSTSRSKTTSWRAST